jgi:hypothetical protein
MDFLSFYLSIDFIRCLFSLCMCNVLFVLICFLRYSCCLFILLYLVIVTSGHLKNYRLNENQLSFGSRMGLGLYIEFGFY